MGINVGDVETVLSARDTMSPTLVNAAQRVKDLRMELASLGSTTGSVFKSLNDQLTMAEEKFSMVAAAVAGGTTPAIIELERAHAKLKQGMYLSGNEMDALEKAAKKSTTAMKETEEATTSMGRSLDQTAGMAQRLVERLVILWAIKGAVTLAVDILQVSDNLVKMNATTDMSIAKLQEIKYASDLTGTEFTKTATAISTMEKKLGEAKMSTADALNSIGLSFERVFSLNPDQRFDLIVSSIAAITDPLQRTKVEMEIFGTDGIDPLIKRFGELSDAANKSGVIMEDGTVHTLSNILNYYRTFGREMEPVIAGIVERWSRFQALLMGPAFGADKRPTQELIYRILLGENPVDMILGTGGANAPPPLFRGAITSDINLPAPGAQQGGPLMGQAFIDNLYAQSLAVKTLTGEQWIQLQQLRDMNQLTADNAARIGVTTGQFKGYQDAIAQWNKEAAKALATQKEWDTAINNLLATGLDLDTASPADFLRAGASPKDIQVYYGMAASAVRQLQMDIREESKEETIAAREREQAARQTEQVITHTGQLWDQYAQLTARVEEGSMAARMAGVDTWYNHEVAILNKKVVNEKDYSEALDAIQAVAGAKRLKVQNDQNDQDEKSLMKLTTEWDAYYQVIEKGSGTAVSIQMADVQRWFDNEVAHIKANDTYWQAHYDILWQTAQAKMDLIIHAQDPLWLAWRGLNKDMRVEWAATWDEALMGTGSFVSALVKPFTDIEHQFTKMLAGMIANWEQSLLTPLINSTNRIMGGMFIPGGATGVGSGASGASVGMGSVYTSSTAAAENMLASTATTGFAGMIVGGTGIGGTAAAGATVAGTAATAAVTAGIAAAIVGGIALFKYIFRDKLPEDVARDAGEKFGQKWDEGLSKTVTDAAKKFHDEMAGEIASLPAIIAATPINQSNLAMYTARIHDIFSMIEMGHFTVAQATKTLDDVFPELAAASTDAYGRINDGLREIIELNRIFGTESKEISDWQKAQAAKGLSGYAAVQAASAPTTPGMLGDLGQQAIGAYAVSVATGSTPSDALKAISPSLTALEDQYKKLGIEVDNVALKNLFLQNTILKANPALLAGISGLTDEMVSWINLGVETEGLFRAQETSGTDMYARLLNAAIDANGGYDQLTGAIVDFDGANKLALTQMQSYLHIAKDEAEKLNIPLDDATQHMIDMSKDAGVWQDNITPKPTLIGVMGDLRDIVKELVDLLANKLPKKVTVDVGINTPPTDGIIFRPGPVEERPRPPEFAGGTPGSTDTVLGWLTPGEAVLTRQATTMLGMNFINAINSGMGIPGYAEGGRVAAPGTGMIDSASWESGLFNWMDGMSSPERQGLFTDLYRANFPSGIGNFASQQMALHRLYGDSNVIFITGQPNPIPGELGSFAFDEFLDQIFRHEMTDSTVDSYNNLVDSVSGGMGDILRGMYDDERRILDRNYVFGMQHGTAWGPETQFLLNEFLAHQDYLSDPTTNRLYAMLYPNGYSNGGIVTGSGGVDSQLIRATPGEAVLTPGAVSRIGSSGVAALNSGSITAGGGGGITIGQFAVNVYPPTGTDMTDPSAIARAAMIALREDREFLYTAVQIIAQRTIDAQS